MRNELIAAARAAAEFLDGVCIGQSAADAQRYEIAKALFEAIKANAEDAKCGV